MPLPTLVPAGFMFQGDAVSAYGIALQKVGVNFSATGPGLDLGGEVSLSVELNIPDRTVSSPGGTIVSPLAGVSSCQVEVTGRLTVSRTGTSFSARLDVTLSNSPVVVSGPFETTTPSDLNDIAAWVRNELTARFEAARDQFVADALPVGEAALAEFVAAPNPSWNSVAAFGPVVAGQMEANLEEHHLSLGSSLHDTLTVIQSTYDSTKGAALQAEPLLNQANTAIGGLQSAITHTSQMLSSSAAAAKARGAVGDAFAQLSQTAQQVAQQTAAATRKAEEVLGGSKSPPPPPHPRHTPSMAPAALGRGFGIARPPLPPPPPPPPPPPRPVVPVVECRTPRAAMLNKVPSQLADSNVGAAWSTVLDDAAASAASAKLKPASDQLGDIDGLTATVRAKDEAVAQQESLEKQLAVQDRRIIEINVVAAVWAGPHNHADVRSWVIDHIANYATQTGDRYRLEIEAGINVKNSLWGDPDRGTTKYFALQDVNGNNYHWEETAGVVYTFFPPSSNT